MLAPREFLGNNLPSQPRHEGPADGLLRWHERLFLRGMEREFLSREVSRQADARLLLTTFSHGRNQQHVLPATNGTVVAHLDRAGERGLPVCAESAARNHARKAPHWRWRDSGVACGS